MAGDTRLHGEKGGGLSPQKGVSMVAGQARLQGGAGGGAEPSSSPSTVKSDLVMGRIVIGVVSH